MKGYFKITYKVESCTTTMGIVCISAVTVWYVLPDQSYNVTIDDSGALTINGLVYTDNINNLYRPFRDENIYVKKVTSLLYLVGGFGFKLLYDPNGRIYLVLDPYYKNRVCESHLHVYARKPCTCDELFFS